MANKLTFRPTESAKKRPRRIQVDGVWGGVGNELVLKGKAPKSDVKVPEATAEQYRRLFELEYYELVECVRNGKIVDRFEAVELLKGSDEDQ